MQLLDEHCHEKTYFCHLSRVMRKPMFCLSENKDADQLRGNRKFSPKESHESHMEKICLLGFGSGPTQTSCRAFWFGLRLYVPVNNFSVMSGRSHSFLGITSTFREVNVSCSRIQHGNLSEDRTPDLLPRV